MLNRQVPGLHVRILEIRIYRKKRALYERRNRHRNYAVCWNHRLDEVGETILKGRHLSIGKHGRVKRPDGRVKFVVRSHGEIVSIAVVWEWRVANAEAGADDRFFPQPVSQAN